ncbi:MAG: hypothetical protein AAB294_02060 [Pseudomonadota bacterium]
MSASPTTPEPQERGAWLRTLYQLTHSDTRWAKEQGWRVVNWTLLLFGALLAIAHLLAPHFSLCAFVIAGLFLLAVGIYYLVGLHCWALSNRRSAEQLEAQIPKDVVSLLDRRAPGEKHLPYLLVQVGIVTVAFVLVLAVHILKNVAV